VLAFDWSWQILHPVIDPSADEGTTSGQ
jgi:hypothetical protein